MSSPARDLVAANAVIAKLAHGAPGLHFTSLSVYAWGAISIHAPSREVAMEWGKFLGSYSEFTTLKYPDTLTCQAEGKIDGFDVSAGCNVETCACGKPAAHLVADEESADWPCLVPGGACAPEQSVQI